MSSEVKDRESCQFNAEVHKVLNLVINHIYTNQDIFVRELISNASDACDKLRYLRLKSDPAGGETTLATDDLKVTVSINKEGKRLIFEDNGVGMSKEELRENLGTIARSGTQQFFEALKEKNNDLIGQFGVGFYSVFIVADKVEVVSRKFDSEEVWLWSSDGKESFTLERFEEPFERGTRIILNIKENSEGYLDRFKIEHIINTYSDHIKFPIELMNDQGEAEKINEIAAIWTLPPAQVTEKQYNGFFKTVAQVGGEPWLTLHNRHEGMIEYTNLLFIPSIKPFDLFNPERRCSVKLYVKRVFITEDNANIIPRHMRFVRGVVDSEDLPLNISRETLQENSVIDRIRSSLTKKILSELKKKLADDRDYYLKFWDNFGAVLKEGLCEAMDNESRQRLLETCLFHSLNQDKLISLDDYIADQKENQNTFFYLTGNDLQTLKNSPQLEGFVKRGIDVLLLTDPVDDFWASVVQDYKNVKFKSAADSAIDLNEIVYLKDEDESSNDNESDEKKKEKEELHQQIQDCFKEVLGDKISKVVISKKLTNSPVCLVTEAGRMNSRMERFMMEQNQLAQKSPKVLEVNAGHGIVISVLAKYKLNKENVEVKDIISLLFTQACILEGESIDDPTAYAKTLNSLLEKIS